ncbi:MAG: NB-ARC domain-containing protein [Cyanobacteria bacterium P01_C01_bin.89]
MTEERRIDTDGGDYREVNVGDRGQYAEGHIYNYNVNPYKPRIPFQVPPVPGHFVPRPQYANRIREQLLSDNADQPGTLVVSAIHGLGGIGKSVLAAAIAHEPEIRDRFPDGILWITLGQQPDLLVALGDWIRSLGDRDYKPTTVQAASSYLRSLLVDKTMLLVVDDLWDPGHFSPFRLAGKGCRVLVTTRQVRLKDSQPCELGLLTAAESVALVERRLGSALAEGEREIFEEFARAVGFLPLALELAAVQVEDGYDWASLLADFREEFDILDVDEGAGSDEVRRDRSLRACFNLSLKRLDGEQLRQFAWLGVLPEDVSVDARMVATLWEVPTEQARQELEDFWERSLLLSGVSISISGQQVPTFRQHDLLHDLAQQLLGRAEGLSVEAAHGELLARYQPRSGRWWDLADDGYIHRRLTWHMERAGQIAQMHELIRAADGNGRNAWGEACEGLGLLTVFVEDVARAWRCAEEHYGIIPTEAEGWRWQFWCAFAMGSLNSLVGNIPGELLATAVRQGHWSETRAIAYALQKWSEFGRVEALESLMPHLQSRVMVDEAVQAAHLMAPRNRDRVFAAVIEHQPDYWTQEEAVAITRRMEQFWYQVPALSVLAVKQPELFEEALDIISNIENKSWLDDSLCSLLKTLPIELMARALTLAESIGEDQYWSRSRALTALAHRLPLYLLDRAINAAHQITDKFTRVEILAAFVEKWPRLLEDALSITHQIDNEKHFQRISALIQLSKYQPSLLEEAAVIAKTLDNKIYAVDVLIAKAKTQPDLCSEALEAVSQISIESLQADALYELIAILPPELFDRALEMAYAVADEDDDESCVFELAMTYLPPHLFNRALALTRRIDDSTNQARMFQHLAEQEPSFFHDALTTISQLGKEKERAIALSQLVNTLPVQLLNQVLDMTRQLDDAYHRVWVFRWLVKRQPELLDEAVATIRQLQDCETQLRELRCVTDELPLPLLREAWEIAGQIERGFGQAWALPWIAKKLPDVTDAAIEKARQIEDFRARASALIRFVELRPKLCGEALEAITQIEGERKRAYELETLTQELPPQWVDELLQVTRQITAPFPKAMVLVKMVKRKPELWNEALITIRQIEESPRRERDRALGSLAVALPVADLEQALAIASQITDESTKGRTWQELAEQLPASLSDQALAIIRGIPDSEKRAWGLRKLAEQQDKLDLWDEMLEAISTVSESRPLSHFIEFVIKQLPLQLIPKARRIAMTISDPYDRGVALLSFSDSVSWQALAEQSENLLRLLSVRDRSNLTQKLPDCYPTLLELGGQPAVDAALDAMRDACNQWP